MNKKQREKYAKVLEEQDIVLLRKIQKDLHVKLSPDELALKPIEFLPKKRKSNFGWFK